MSKTLRKACLESFQETVHERSVMAGVATAQCYDNGAETKHGPAAEDDVTRQLKHMVCYNLSPAARANRKAAEQIANVGFEPDENDNGQHHDATTEAIPPRIRRNGKFI